MRFLFLGTGGSLGVPVIGCRCAVCLSRDPRNKRFRSSGLLTIGGKRVLIDCGTDLRQQALKFGIDAIDALLITHAHQDHVGGMDDLRAFFFRRKEPLPLYLSKTTYQELVARFPYVFEVEKEGKLLPRFTLHFLEGECGSFSLFGEEVRYFAFSQAGMGVTGFRFGKIAYLSDIKEYSDSLFEELIDLNVLIISALRIEPSDLHFTVSEAVAFSKRVAAKKSYFTHIAHELDAECVELPKNMELAYDGLELLL